MNKILEIERCTYFHLEQKTEIRRNNNIYNFVHKFMWTSRRTVTIPQNRNIQHPVPQQTIKHTQTVKRPKTQMHVFNQKLTNGSLNSLLQSEHDFRLPIDEEPRGAIRHSRV